MAIILGGNGVDAEVVIGPNIVTDGLIFYIDPADTTSLVTKDNALLANNVEIDYVYGLLGDTQRVNLVSDTTGCPFYSVNNQGFISTGINGAVSSRGKFSKELVVGYNLSIDFWIAPNTSGGGTWLSADSVTNPVRYGHYPLLQTSAGAIDTWGYRSISRTLINNKWINIVLVFTEETVAYYVDGTYRGRGTRDTSETLPASKKIQVIGGIDTFPTGYGDGSFGPVKIYNRTLTAQEVYQNYNAMKKRYTI